MDKIKSLKNIDSIEQVVEILDVLKEEEEIKKDAFLGTI